MAKAPAATKILSVEDMLDKLAVGLKQQALKPNIQGYTPHAKQKLFHELDKKGRLYIGGNRSGKSYAAVAEDVWWLTGTHPYLDTPEPPIRGRVVTVDFIYGLEQIVLPLFKILLPGKYLKGGSWEQSYSKQYRTLTLTNGSTVEFMSYEQDTEKFAGTSRHFVHYDEEPPKHIFNECNARIIDTDGNYWVSMTPVEGLTWTFETIYEPGIKGTANIGVVEADMLDNPHISRAAAETYLSGLDKEEREAREHGTYVQLGGLVYKQFHTDTHVIEPQLPPKDWRWYMSLDHGYNAPTAVLWHAVSPLNYIITFDEIYQREWTIDQVASEIKRKWQLHGKTPEFCIADPAISQRSAINGTSIQTEYSIRGVYFALANNDVVTGVAKVQSYLRTNPETGKPFRQITENCSNFISEMKKLRWKTYASKKMQFANNAQEAIHKKDDHACDSDRYFHTFLPNLAPPTPEDKVAMEPPVGSAAGRVKPYGTIDDVLAAMTNSKKNSVPQSKFEEPSNWYDTTYDVSIDSLEYD